jgi:RNA polymerase sigma-70 factor, ECF subfamily
MTPYASLSTEELILRCIHGGDVSLWQEFSERFRVPIAKAVFRAAARFGGSNRSIIDDLVQETYLKLCSDDFRILRNFQHRHAEAFTAFLQVVAANITRDHFRSLNATRHGGTLVEPISDDAMPATEKHSDGSAGTMERQVLLAEVARHLDGCVTGPDRQRNVYVFWLYYRTGLSARAIADLPSIDLSPKGVESLVLRITRDLRQRMESHSPRQTKLHPDEGFFPSTPL